MAVVSGMSATRKRKRERMMAELTPRLRAARRVERELDRFLARRFNAFKYLRTDELGLSRILADMLDPGSEHGQEDVFLQKLLQMLPQEHVLPRKFAPAGDLPIKVETERHTIEDRRIDICVDIPTGDGMYCLAFENKPYAEDLRCQVLHYLKFLNARFEGRFLLVYVPPEDRMPDEISFPATEHETWSEHFCVMPYAGEGLSLENWVAECRRSCDIERLNWFLRQLEDFCRERFGDASMTSGAETREIREYLRENPSQLRSALAIHDAWPEIRDEICEKFLEHLRDRLESKLRQEISDFDRGLRVRCVYGGGKAKATALWVTRDRWPAYEVRLQCGAFGPNSWFWGVRFESSGEETEQQLKFRESLKRALDDAEILPTDVGTHMWPKSQWLDAHANWYQLAPELVGEIECGEGNVTDHFVSGLLRIATRSIPVLDEFAESGN